MRGFLSLVLHAHLPFVRHPEHEKMLEEGWLFEAITETYIPLLQVLEGWQRDEIPASITLTLSPTLCAMLRDPLLLDRYQRQLDELIELAEKEIHRTLFEKAANEIARFYHSRLIEIRAFFVACDRALLPRLARLQEQGRLEIITCAATHAILPLLLRHPPSVRAQVLVARDDYGECFGRDPRGIWLPECAYAQGLETTLREAGFRWFITETHGVLQANPKPRYSIFAPILTEAGVAAFGRDLDSAKQVWSRDEGYPGDPRYRDFYRDIGFDLDFDYVKDYRPPTDRRGFTGIKYYRITGGAGDKEFYQRAPALEAVEQHAAHFLNARIEQIGRLSEIMDRPWLVISPYDAELFGHWWYEGPEFLDRFVRKATAGQGSFELITPGEYLRRQTVLQVATPAPSTWGEGGHLKVWLNEKNEWIQPLLATAERQMTELAHRFTEPDPLQNRALKQASRELLLAQSSDWPFILRTGTSPEYATRRVKAHLARFAALHEQLMNETLDEPSLSDLEQRDNLFPNVNWNYWR